MKYALCACEIFCPFGAKCLGVCAVRTHFEGAVPQRQIERVLGSPVLTEANSVVCGGAASAPSEEGAGAPEGYKGATEGEITRGRCLHRGVDEYRVKSGHLLLLLPISSAFAHTRCISPSVCLLKSFMQASTSLLRGRRGRSRAEHSVTAL